MITVQADRFGGHLGDELAARGHAPKWLGHSLLLLKLVAHAQPLRELGKLLIVERAARPAYGDKVFVAEMLAKPAIVARLGVMGWQPVANVIGVAAYRLANPQRRQRHG